MPESRNAKERGGRVGAGTLSELHYDIQGVLSEQCEEKASLGTGSRKLRSVLFRVRAPTTWPGRERAAYTRGEWHHKKGERRQGFYDGKGPRHPKGRRVR